MSITALVVLIWLALAAGLQAGPNFLVVITDDLGMEHLGLTPGLAVDPVATPNIDSLAAGGLVLTNLWTAPLCSPSRALLMTGRHAHLTGVGSHVTDGATLPLPLAELTVPELLGDAGYATALFGKWHLGHSDEVGGREAPNLQGFDHFCGVIHGDIAQLDETLHQEWWESTDGSEPIYRTGYLDRTIYANAENWIAMQTGPWLTVVAGLLPHAPYSCPPPELHPTESCGGEAENYRAMIEAHDILLGDLLASIPEDTVVIWFSDNGSPVGLDVAPVPAGRAKTTLWQGGITVPAIVSGPMVRTGIESAPISSASFLATIAEWAGAAIPADVEPSVADCLAEGLRCGSTVVSQFWGPNRSTYPPAWGALTGRNDRYKMIVKIGKRTKMFDLETDPWEQVPLLRAASPDDWDELMNKLLEIRDDWWW